VRNDAIREMRGRSKTFVNNITGPISLVATILMFWWIRRTLPDFAIHPPDKSAWVLIFVICMFCGVSLAQVFMMALWPRQVILAGGRRGAALPFVMGLILFGTILVAITRHIPLWPGITAVALAPMLIAVVRTFRCRLPTVKPEVLPMTPVDRPQVTTRTTDYRWDIFLSYRVTPDSNAVRRFAESLLRQGYRPWFAEYEIPMDEWDDKEAIARRLAEGVAGSRYFLVFTNDAWAESVWCNAEMNAILEKTASESATRAPLGGIVAEVRLPPATKPHVVFPPLADAPHFDVRDDILEVWQFIERDLRWLPLRHAEEPLRQEEDAVRLSRSLTLVGGYRTRLGGLAEREDVFDPAHRVGQHEVQIFDGEWRGKPVRLRITTNPFRGNMRLYAGVPSVSDDRSVHRTLVLSFRDWAREAENLQPLATHVVHLADGHSAFAMSSLIRGQSSACRVERRYVLPLHPQLKCPRCKKGLVMLDESAQPSPNDILVACENSACDFAELWPVWEQRLLGEMEYEFLLPVGEPTRESGLLAQAEFAPLMDATVISTRRRWFAPMLEWQAVAVLAFFSWVAVEGYRFQHIALGSPRTQAVWATLAGYFAAGTVLSAFLGPVRRRIMAFRYGAKTKVPLGSWFVRWWNVAKGAMVFSLLAMVAGLLPAGLIAIICIGLAPERAVAFAPVLGAAVCILAAAQMLDREHGEPAANPQSTLGTR